MAGLGVAPPDRAPATARVGAAGRIRGAVEAGAANPLLRQALTFGAIGVVSTLAYLVLYSALRSALAATLANAIALVSTSVGNTAANRRLTFAKRGRRGVIHDQAAGFAALAISLAVTTSAVGILDLVAPTASRALELVVLGVANACATICRFAVLRSWIAPPDRSTTRERVAP